MAPSSEPAPKHIPAWKKLGLKLKYAKEEQEDVIGSTNQAVNGKKRKSFAENGTAVEPTPTDRSVKKAKRSKSKENNPPVTSAEDFTTNTVPQTTEPSSSAIVATPVSKRKSVAFTPETKTEDGDSVKQLYKTWYANQLVENPLCDPSVLSPALKSITPRTITAAKSQTSEVTQSSPPPSASKTKSKKPKNKKKGESKPSPISLPSDPPTEHPAISYLTTHNTSPSTWKFSKPHQNHLLKHLFSLTHIQPSHDVALLSYLRGLKGTSARSRIRQQALTIRSEDEEWLASEPTDAEKEAMDNETHEQCRERKRSEYEDAVKRVKESLRAKEEEREWELGGERDEWEERLRKRRRAEVVLWGVGEEEEEAENPTPLPPHATSKNNDFRHGGQEFPKGRGKGMGGVEEISASGIAKASQGKKIVFDDGGVGVKQGNRVNGLQKMNGKAAANEGQVKSKRKRKRRTGVPDDDDSSSDESSRSSSSSEESEEDTKPALGKQVNGKGKSGDAETSSSSGSGSGSGSESGSSEDSDSDCLVI